MRIPHYLARASNGVFYFNIRVPRHLQPLLGLKVFRRSLYTRDPVKARSYSSVWSLHYAQAFGKLDQGNDMAPKPPSIDEIVRSVRGGSARNYEVTFDPQTRALTGLKTDGTAADNEAAQVLIGTVFAPPMPAPSAPLTRGKTLAAACLEYAMTEAKELKQNTNAQRQRAIASFVGRIGQNTLVRDVTRTMAAAWARDLIAGGMTKRTVSNMVSHAAQPFEAFRRWGEIDGENPVKGVVVMTLKEKRKRKNDGHQWEPFELDDLKRIFDPSNLKRKRKEHVWWGALIALYTGARVGEIAQIFLRDFTMIDGVACVRLWQESDGQTQKTESSRRLVPLHPVLLELGLWQRVERLRKANEERLFPGMEIDSKAGPGNALSKGFSYYIVKQLGLKPRRAHGTIGFHSLRKNVIQELQGSRLHEERRRAFVGHESSGVDVHEENYMRLWTADELAALFPGLRWGEWLDIDGLKELLNPA